MTTHAWIVLGLFIAIVLLCAKPLGLAIACIIEGHSRVVRRIEMPVLRWCGVHAEQEMSWRAYALAILLFSLAGLLFTYALQRLQLGLPLNPQQMPNVSPDSAFNTAVSFVTNTNWQGYSGEVTMSYLTQMLALAVQNFMSAATGIAVAFALIRGIARHSTQTIGNAWVDLWRATVFILLPLSFALALLLIGQGVIQNVSPYLTLGGTGQTLAMGPVASQEAIKMLGTNGGGFLNVNSAHPFENPTPLSNFLQMLAIFLIPAALCYSFGRVIGDTRQAWALLAAMTILFLCAVIPLTAFEQAGNPTFTGLGIDQSASALQAGGNMEGKEVRFGIAESSLFAAVTTAASCGAVNAMHDSLTPLGGLVPTALMQLGEVVFGGVGSGLYGMLIFALLAVFVAGLMIGRTPEYLGKKIEAFDMKMIAIAILVTPILVLAGTAIVVMSSGGTAGIFNPGTHGFSEVLYALSSAANNNGSAFAGLSANSPFYNTLLGMAMWFGRFAVIVPVLAIAGSLAAKNRLPAHAGTMPTHGPLFVILLIGSVLLVGALNYVPALALGPVVEHLMLFH